MKYNHAAVLVSLVNASFHVSVLEIRMVRVDIKRLQHGNWWNIYKVREIMWEHHYGRRHRMHLQGKIMLRMMFLISLLGGLVRDDTQGKWVG